MMAANQDEHGNDPRTIGARIRDYREQRGWTLSKLAEESELSKGYLSQLENAESDKRPSASTLYALAKALGVTMSDLLGQQLLTEPADEIPAELLQLAREDQLPQADVRMLASISFRGERPQTVQRWRYIYQAIAGSTNLDSRTPHRPRRA
jgi:transcriptional regulator with XRE-family HTH domain